MPNSTEVSNPKPRLEAEILNLTIARNSYQEQYISTAMRVMSFLAGGTLFALPKIFEEQSVSKDESQYYISLMLIGLGFYTYFMKLEDSANKIREVEEDIGLKHAELHLIDSSTPCDADKKQPPVIQSSPSNLVQVT